MRFSFAAPLMAVLSIFSVSLPLKANIPLSGHGVKSMGMGGVAAAYPQDSLVVGTNPAGLAWIADRYDINLNYLRRMARVDIWDNPVPQNNSHYIARPDALIPSGGIKKEMMGCSVGFAGYVRGWGSEYPKVVHLTGTEKLKAVYTQFLFKPCIAYKWCNQSFGIGLNLDVNQFCIRGAENSRPFSVSPNHVSHKGYEYELGVGVHVGWVGQFFEDWKLGLAYESKIYNRRFYKYRGLFPSHGVADGTAVLHAGISWQATSCLALAFDYQRFFWKQLPYVANKVDSPALLGTKHGPGSGWNNTNGYRYGLSYQYSDELILRMGGIHNSPLFDKSQMAGNIAGTGIVSDQFTCGATWNYDCHHEIDCAYIHGFRKKKQSELPAALGGGKIRFTVLLDWLQFSYNYLF